jgi:hypothetical protein
MSEFSESYHLEAEAQQDGVGLLQRAHLEGFVLAPKRGWVTLIPRSEFGQPPDALVEANQGCLLHYLLDQDAGWMFAVYSGPLLASYYECRWLDWSDPEDRIKVDASDVDVEVVWALAQRHGHDPQLLELERILHPRVERRTDEETGAHYDGFVDWPWRSDAGRQAPPGWPCAGSGPRAGARPGQPSTVRLSMLLLLASSL